MYRFIEIYIKISIFRVYNHSQNVYHFSTISRTCCRKLWRLKRRGRRIMGSLGRWALYWGRSQHEVLCHSIRSNPRFVLSASQKLSDPRNKSNHLLKHLWNLRCFGRTKANLDKKQRRAAFEHDPKTFLNVQSRRFPIRWTMDKAKRRIFRLNWLLWGNYPYKANHVVFWQNCYDIHLSKICHILYRTFVPIINTAESWLENEIHNLNGNVSIGREYRIPSNN